MHAGYDEQKDVTYSTNIFILMALRVKTGVHGARALLVI